MANNLRKFQNEAEYSAATLNYPAVSWVVNGEVHFDKTAPATFGGLTVKYNITNTTVEYTLFNGGGGSSSSSESSSESGGGGGALPTTMIVDGVEETPINTWRFETAGEHIVQYTFEDNTVPLFFINGNIIPSTEVIVGTDITGIGSGAFYTSNLTSATCLSTTPPNIVDISSFGGGGGGSVNYPIYVPAASVNDYKSASVWSSLASRIQAIQ